jgi:hypothetical protein
VSTLTKAKAPVKTETVTRELLTLSDGSLGLHLETIVGRKVAIVFYHLERLACADVAYTLTKFSRDKGTDPSERQHHVNLSDPTCGCSCRGWARHGHCKHHAACASLRKEGAL